MTIEQQLEERHQEVHKAERRRRFENRTGPVHLRGGRRQKIRHTRGHGRGRPVPKFDPKEER